MNYWIHKVFLFLTVAGFAGFWITSSFSNNQPPIQIPPSQKKQTDKALSVPPPPPLPLDYASFSRIPILHVGRVKPLSSFAREYLLVLYGKSSLPNCSAESWLAETLFDPQTAFKREIFKILNPDIVDVLNLKKKQKSFYSFNEITKSLDKILTRLNTIKNKKEEERTLIENQLLDLYGKTLAYFKLSRSLSLIWPFFSLQDQKQSKKIGMISGKPYNYLEVLKFQQKIKQEVQSKIKTTQFNQLSSSELELLALARKIDIMSKDEHNDLFRIIPPQWKDNKALWHSPWSLIKTGKGSPASADYLKSWIELEKAYREKTGIKWALEKTHQKATTLSKKFVNSKILFLEKTFNDLKFFQKSLCFYILAMLFFLFGGLFQKKGWLLKFSSFSLLIGALIHLIGIVFRILILARPPVATLYESIIFVGFIVVATSLILYYLDKKKLDNLTLHSLGQKNHLFMGAIVGTTLHLLALKYKGAESMSLLVPVLNSNFWLTSHVLCITIGYSFAIMSSVIAHIYIFLKCFWGNSTQVFSSLNKSMSSAGLLALFFCLFGTILGGIWADQSWGRFWGWDPKENGALFIVIWLLVLLHGKMAGILKKDGLALGHILTNITVALSWFGVNLLNIGLHSYGFISGVALGLSLFCGLELAFFLFALVKLFVLKKRTFRKRKL